MIPIRMLMYFFLQQTGNCFGFVEFESASSVQSVLKVQTFSSIGCIIFVGLANLFLPLINLNFLAHKLTQFCLSL